MKNISQNQLSEYFRDNIIISKFSNIFKILKAIKEKPNGSYNEFKKILSISGGALHNRLKDAKIMRLYNNGGNKILTPLGEKWLNEVKPSNETIKEACLNVPLFNLLYKEQSDIIVQAKIFEYFKNSMNSQYVDGKLINMAVRRYLEGIHNLHIERRGKLRLSKQQNISQNPIFNYVAKPKEINNPIEEYIILHKQLKDLKQKYGIQNIKQILELV